MVVPIEGLLERSGDSDTRILCALLLLRAATGKKFQEKPDSIWVHLGKGRGRPVTEEDLAERRRVIEAWTKWYEGYRRR